MRPAADYRTIAALVAEGTGGEWLYTSINSVPYMSIEIMATNASSQVYSSLEDVSYDPPEPTPVGLAQSLYESLAGPWADITLGRHDDEVTGAIRPGMLLDNQPVQEVTEILSAGATKITAGPPIHLGHSDLVTLLRSRRDRILTDAWRRRKTGKSTT